MGLGQKVAAAALALGIGLGSGGAMAQDGQIRTLAELQRTIAPGNLDPSMKTREKRFDKDGDGHKETVGRLYFTKDGGRIAVYSHNDIPYLIAVDSDRVTPFDYSRKDTGCTNTFNKKVSADESHPPPNCTYVK